MEKKINQTPRKIMHGIRNEMSYIATYIHQSKKLIDGSDVDELFKIANDSYDKIRSMLDTLTATFQNKSDRAQT